VYYEEVGQGEPLLLLHGATGAVGFDSVGRGALPPAFAERDRTFSLEHRGRGRTDNPAGRLSSAQIAADVAAFLGRPDLAPAHVAGFSDGAIVGLALGVARPDLLRSLVCVGANYRTDARLVADTNRVYDPAWMERAAPAWVAAMERHHDPHHYPGYWRELVGQLRAMLAAELAFTEADLGRIPVSTLLIAGEADRFASLDRPWTPDRMGSLDQILGMRRGIPRSELLILNHAGLDGDAGHAVQHTRADLVGPVVLEFLGRHARPAHEASA
jgi:pimeloyl-ACP methyl ester carboxylesterase